MELEGRTPPWREGVPFTEETGFGERPLFPREGEPVKVVQPFPTVTVPCLDEIVVPPREWGTLVTPEPQRILAA